MSKPRTTGDGVREPAQTAYGLSSHLGPTKGGEREPRVSRVPHPIPLGDLSPVQVIGLYELVGPTLTIVVNNQSVNDGSVEFMIVGRSD
jgi:hypothetical protein